MTSNPLYKIYKPQNIEFLPVSKDNDGMYSIAIRGWPFTVLQFYKGGAEYSEAEATQLLEKLEEDFLDKGIFNPKDWSPDAEIIKLPPTQQLMQKHGGSIIDDIGNVFTNSYSRATKQVLTTYGGYQILAINIIREPVDKPIRDSIDALTKGKPVPFEYQRLGYDALFHLYMIIKCQAMGKTVYLLTEKRPNIIWETRKTFDASDLKKAQFIKVNISKEPPHTIKSMIEFAMNAMGDRFHTYDARDNNCQDYILNLAHGCGFYGGDEFIKQPVEDVIAELPDVAPKAAKVLTDIAHFFGRVTGGARKSSAFPGPLAKKKKMPKPILNIPEDRELKKTPLYLPEIAKAYLKRRVEAISLSHEVVNIVNNTPVSYRDAVEQATAEDSQVVLKEYILVNYHFANGVIMSTRKIPNGQVQFVLANKNVLGPYSVTIDLSEPDETEKEEGIPDRVFTLGDFLQNVTVGMTDKQYAKEVVKVSGFKEYLEFVDQNYIYLPNKPFKRPEFQNAKELSDYSKLSAEQRRRLNTKPIIADYRNAVEGKIPENKRVDPFAKRPEFKPPARIPVANPNPIYNPAFGVVAAINPRVPLAQQNPVQREFARRLQEYRIQHARDVADVVAEPNLGDLFGNGISSQAAAYNLLIKTHGDDIINSLGIYPGQITVLLDGNPYTIAKNNKFNFMVIRIQNEELAKQYALSPPMKLRDVVANVLNLKPADFTRQVLKNIYSNQHRGGSANDETASVSVDILENVQEILKENPELADIVEAANVVGDLVSAATLKIFDIHGPYEQISKKSDLQILPLEQFALTDQLIWRVLNANTTQGTIKRGFKDENYPFLQLPESHPFYLIQEQITSAHGH